MSTPSVLVLCNQPVLPKDHPEAESEHSVVEIADKIATILGAEGFHVSNVKLGADPTVLWQELKERRPDVVFNLYEGLLNHAETESYVAGLLDWAGVPHTGSPFATLTLACAKHLTKYLLRGARLPSADFLVVDRLPVPKCRLKYPVFVKPAQQDASVGVDQQSVCENQQQLVSRVQYILATYGSPVLVEEFVGDREFNVVLVELPDLQCLPPSEITFPRDANSGWPIVTYEGKWTPGSVGYDQTPVKFPAELADTMIGKLDRLARKTYRLLGCRDYARVDFRMDAAGKLYILEVNPNPEISDDGGFMGTLKSAGLSYRDFILRLIRQALSRKDAARPTFTPTPFYPTRLG